MLIRPGVIARLRAAVIREALELRPRHRIERPSLRTRFPRRARTVERFLTFSSIKARQMLARHRRPEDAVALDVAAATDKPRRDEALRPRWPYIFSLVVLKISLSSDSVRLDK